MKFFIYIISILIVLFKTGNVLSDSNLFNVNNIEISTKEIKNKQNLVNKAFKKGFEELISRLLLKEDFKNLSDLKKKKKLISYYQILTDYKDESKF